MSFSITVVTLTLASSQYSSRVVGNFMRDRANQTVLGVFLGIFAYCLVVLRTIRSGDEGRFVPSLAVLVGLALAFVAIGHLIFFIHHVAASIQASSIIATTTRETLSAIERLFPEPLGEAAQPSERQKAALAAVAAWEKIRAPRSGYLQAVDADRLLQTAKSERVVIRLERAIGEFVTEGSVMASTSRAPSTDGVAQVQAAFAVGKQRTLQQDAAYGITQLVDVALRALSPGINDTTTAVHCVDYLGVILARLVDRRLIDPYRSDGDELRVVARGPAFPDLLGEAFGELRRAAPSNVTVIIRLLQVLRELHGRATDVENRRAIEAQSALIADSAALNVPSYHDRSRIEAVRRADAA